MKLSHKNILLISPEPWSHIFVSKHHYAIHLGNRENQVYYLNPPSNSYEVIKTNYKNAWVVNYKGFPQGVRFFPVFLQKFYFKKVFQQLQKLCNVEFDIVWSFDNSVFYDFSALPKKVLTISHIVDLNQNFQTATAARTADICLCTTYFIQKTLLKYNKKTWKIGHGYEPNLLGECEFQLSSSKNAIKVGYAGNLDSMYIDWDLLHVLIKNNITIQFYFAGPLNNPDKEQFLNECKNIIYTGKLNKRDLKLFYSKMDLLLLTYKADHFKEQLANPHKMMEYLASGKMIVATQTLEYKQLVEDGLFLMTNENKEFPQLFQKAVENLTHWNNEEMQSARRAFALDNTYDKQIDRIESIINSYEGAFG